MANTTVSRETFEVNDLLSQLREFFLQKHPQVEKQQQIHKAFLLLTALNR